MNPAFSVVLLTVASGAGYGMLAWLGILTATRALPTAPWFGVAATLVALVLSAVGLLASTFHLGHPERAWRAISQWRSSWLSREAVLALITNLPALGFAAAWFVAGRASTAAIVLGLLAGLCGLATVACQAMIYASLRPIRQWCNKLVLPQLVLLCLFSGAVWLAAAVAPVDPIAARIEAGLGVTLAIAALVMKLSYWRHIDSGRPVASMETATGLGTNGPVRSLEAPHTEENYLLREMGYAIGRKHATRLRQIAMLAGFVIPAALLLAGMAVPTIAPILMPIAALLSLLGLYAERWLFFAQATHTVTLYYGRHPMPETGSLAPVTRR